MLHHNLRMEVAYLWNLRAKPYQQLLCWLCLSFVVLQMGSNSETGSGPTYGVCFVDTTVGKFYVCHSMCHMIPDFVVADLSWGLGGGWVVVGSILPHPRTSIFFEHIAGPPPQGNPIDGTWFHQFTFLSNSASTASFLKCGTWASSC